MQVVVGSCNEPLDDGWSITSLALKKNCVKGRPRYEIGWFILPKFNSYLQERIVFQPSFLRGELLNFGGVPSLKRTAKSPGKRAFAPKGSCIVSLFLGVLAVRFEGVYTTYTYHLGSTLYTCITQMLHVWNIYLHLVKNGYIQGEM